MRSKPQGPHSSRTSPSLYVQTTLSKWTVFKFIPSSPVENHTANVCELPRVLREIAANSQSPRAWSSGSEQRSGEGGLGPQRLAECELRSAQSVWSRLNPRLLKWARKNHLTFLKPRFLYVENGHAYELNHVPSKFVEILTSTCNLAILKKKKKKQQLCLFCKVVLHSVLLRAEDNFVKLILTFYLYFVWSRRSNACCQKYLARAFTH